MIETVRKVRLTRSKTNLWTRDRIKARAVAPGLPFGIPSRRVMSSGGKWFWAIWSVEEARPSTVAIQAMSAASKDGRCALYMLCGKTPRCWHRSCKPRWLYLSSLSGRGRPCIMGEGQREHQHCDSCLKYSMKPLAAVLSRLQFQFLQFLQLKNPLKVGYNRF